MEDILGKYPNLDAFMPTGGFPQFLPDAYREGRPRSTSDKIACGVAGAGRRRHAAGADRPDEGRACRAARSASGRSRWATRRCIFLKDIKDGKAAPKDPTYTGLDVCTPQNAATCVGGSGS